MNNAEKLISDLETRIIEITQAGQQTENQMKKYESDTRGMELYKAGQCMHNKDSKEGEKEKGIENIFGEIMSENFANLKETDIRIQEAQRAPNKLSPRLTPRRIVIKMAKVKDKRILEAAREKQRVNYKGNSIGLSADFSTETLQGCSRRGAVVNKSD